MIYHINLNNKLSTAKSFVWVSPWNAYIYIFFLGLVITCSCMDRNFKEIWKKNLSIDVYKYKKSQTVRDLIVQCRAPWCYRNLSVFWFRLNINNASLTDVCVDFLYAYASNVDYQCQNLTINNIYHDIVHKDMLVNMCYVGYLDHYADKWRSLSIRYVSLTFWLFF